MFNHIEESDVAIYKQQTENPQSMDKESPQMIQNAFYQDSAPIKGIFPAKPIENCFNPYEVQGESSILNFSNLNMHQEPVMVYDQSFPTSLQGNPFLDCQSQKDEKHEASIDICSVKGNYLCSPENIFPPFETMIT